MNKKRSSSRLFLDLKLNIIKKYFFILIMSGQKEEQEEINITKLPFDEVKKEVIKLENHGTLISGWPMPGASINQLESWQKELRRKYKSIFGSRYGIGKTRKFRLLHSLV